MASILLPSQSLLTTSLLIKSSRLPPPPPRIHFSLSQQKPIITNFQFPTYSNLGIPQISVTRASSHDVLKKDTSLWEKKPVKWSFFLILLWASLYLTCLSGDAIAAAVDATIRTSSFGVKVANALRALGWPAEAVVIAIAALPVVELRGAIPVGYWLELNPIALTVLSILGNMIPVPLIVLYFKKASSFLAGRNETASRFVNMLFENAKQKAGPVKEFQWLGLMLFVAVPFPGTGAWTGAFIASVLDMPFWSAVSANFVGVVLAALLVNLVVNLGLNYAVLAGVILFLMSTFMWTILRRFKNC